MSASPDMESILQQKMEQFRLDPDPADWQAIEERLHPKKRRRFFWWIFPLAGAVLIGGGIYIYSSDQQGIKITEQQRNKPTEQQSNKRTYQNGSNSTEEQQIKPTEQQITENKTTASETIVSKDQRKPIGKSGRITQKTEKDIEQLVSNSAVPEENQQSWYLATVLQDRWRPSLDIPTAIAYSAAPQAAPPKTMAVDSASVTKKIPNKSTHKNKGWYLGTYAGLGRNHPFEPIGGKKAFDQVSNSGSSGFVTYSQGTMSWDPGYHSNLGLLVQKKNKNTEISFGLGFQNNRWSQNYTIYKDSILQNGSLFSRTTIASPRVNYQQLAIEVPLLIGWKLGGKQNSTWWLHTGLNNAFVFRLRENSSTNALTSTPVPGSSTRVTDSLLQTNKRAYLAQWQLGLTYEHSGAKQHWQLRPYLQYGLNSVSKTGEPNVNLFQWGLQWRYYFKKLK